MNLIEKKEVISNYRSSRRRLMLLDYDGTLVPFSDRPEDAKPGNALLKLLETLASDPKNEVVLISGRGKDNLDEWFDLDIGYVAEHGAWIKERGRDWEMIKPLKSDWKKEIFPVLKRYAGKAPGSFIEEKDFSLAWHYRRAGEKLGQRASKELIENIRPLLPDGVHVLKGSMVIEIKNSGVNKGVAALHWIDKEKWDFILALGDDRTDEDTFEALPQDANSINVEPGSSRARFSLASPDWVLSLLKELAEY